MPLMFYVLDLAAILTALAASWLWYSAGSRSVRRVSRHEVLDAADINRLVIAINRSALLNRRAALASAASAACLAFRFGAGLFVS